MAVDISAARREVHQHAEHLAPLDSQPQDSSCPIRLERRFSCHPSSIGAARRAVDELADRLPLTLLADLRLLVSEVVSNSIEHGASGDRKTIRLALSITSDRVRAEVEDDGPGFTPIAVCPPADAPSGRGLFLVDQLAACWGVNDRYRKRVWFELDRDRFETTHLDA